jgi:hypothetical protein
MVGDADGCGAGNGCTGRARRTVPSAPDMEAATASSTKQMQNNLQLKPMSITWCITKITFAQLRELNGKMFSIERFPGKLAPDDTKSCLVSCCRH